MKQISLILLFIFSITNPVYSKEIYIKEGKHNFTLQWIGWEHPGKVNFKKVKGSQTYSIYGEQKSKENDDYLTIEGLIIPVNAKELKFKGKIITKVYHINQGEPCIKEGDFTFKAYGSRKYWRLVEMENCGGGHVVDYIDIYF